MCTRKMRKEEKHTNKFCFELLSIITIKVYQNAFPQSWPITSQIWWLNRQAASGKTEWMKWNFTQEKYNKVDGRMFLLFSCRDVLGKERAGRKGCWGEKKRKHLWRKGQKDIRIEGGRGEKGKRGWKEERREEEKVPELLLHLQHALIQSPMSLVRH